MTDVPHFAFPLRYVNGHAQVNEQDSMDDIEACVTAICLTSPGQRVELPDFGIEDPAFGQEPIPTAPLVSQIQTFEPRVTIMVDAEPDRLDSAVVNAGISMVVSQ
jgi:phage baseplate assembly protein W